MRDSEFFRSRIPEFVEAERRFFSGEMDAKTYKGISGRFGSYAQRGGELGMIRLRMCGGHMDRDKLSFIIDECRRYGVSRIHTTTCETVQLHNLKGDEIAEIMDRALDHGINTQGGGGDNPRNVSATSLSGVEPESLRLSLEALLAGGPWADASLELHIIPLRLRCFSCGTEFGGECGQDALWQPCPQCGEQFGHTVEQGKELRISHLEAS